MKNLDFFLAGNHPKGKSRITDLTITLWILSIILLAMILGILTFSVLIWVLECLGSIPQKSRLEICTQPGYDIHRASHGFSMADLSK